MLILAADGMIPYLSSVHPHPPIFRVTVAQLLNDLHEKLSVMAKEGEWIVQGLLISCLPANWKSLGGRLIATWRGANDGI